MRHEGGGVADDADEDDGQHDDGDATLGGRHGRVGVLARHAHQRPELVGFVQRPQQAEVEDRHQDDGHDVHEHGEENDAVHDGVRLAPGQSRRAVSYTVELDLEEAGSGEQGRHHDHDSHVHVGALLRADALRVERPTHGDVAVDREQDRQPVARQSDEVVERVRADDDVRIRVSVAAQSSGARVHGHETPQQRRHQHQDVDHGEALQQDRRRQFALLVAQHNECDDVGDDAEDDDRHRHGHIEDEPEHVLMMVDGWS